MGNKVIKIIEIEDCSECKYCGGGVMLEAFCGNDDTENRKFDDYPSIPLWCPLPDKKERK